MAQIERDNQLNDRLGTVQIISPETLSSTFERGDSEVELPSCAMIMDQDLWASACNCVHI